MYIQIKGLRAAVEIHKAGIALHLPLRASLSAAMAAVSAIQALGKKELKYRSLQNHFEREGNRWGECELMRLDTTFGQSARRFTPNPLRDGIVLIAT